jgi:hypothetical protein
MRVFFSVATVLPPPTAMVNSSIHDVAPLQWVLAAD